MMVCRPISRATMAHCVRRSQTSVVTRKLNGRLGLDRAMASQVRYARVRPGCSLLQSVVSGRSEGDSQSVKAADPGTWALCGPYPQAEYFHALDQSRSKARPDKTKGDERWEERTSPPAESRGSRGREERLGVIQRPTKTPSVDL